jgi:hypothetical protein
MVKIIGNDVWRSGEKIGFIDGTHIRTHDGHRIGFFEGNYVYNQEGNKTAEIENGYLVSYGGSSKISLDKVNESIEGGVLPEIGKCAVYVLLGN